MEIEPSAIFFPEKKCFSFLGDIYTKCLSGEIYYAIAAACLTFFSISKASTKFYVTSIGLVACIDPEGDICGLLLTLAVASSMIFVSLR